MLTESIYNVDAITKVEAADTDTSKAALGHSVTTRVQSSKIQQQVSLLSFIFNITY